MLAKSCRWVKGETQSKNPSFPALKQSIETSLISLTKLQKKGDGKNVNE